MPDKDKKGKVSVADGIEFSWLHSWHHSSHPDYDPFGDLWGMLTQEGTPPQRWAPKESRRTGNEKIRIHDLLFLLWDIYQEQEHAIPDAVWLARQALEREIMTLPESAL